MSAKEKSGPAPRRVTVEIDASPELVIGADGRPWRMLASPLGPIAIPVFVPMGTITSKGGQA